MSYKRKLKFIVNGGGDWSVGIPDIDAEITIEENLVCFSDEYIKDWKRMISNLYDIPDSCVYTEEEWEKMIKAEEEYFSGMN